jgi:hypothetical protein
MTKQIFYPVIFGAIIFVTISCKEKSSSLWQPAKGQLSTKWAADVSPDNAWPEYPRPQMVRNEWLNLNGLWEYAIIDKDSVPGDFEGQILVPFPVESALSGVAKMVGKEKKLWYKRMFSIPHNWKGKSIYLHFEAVDWETSVWIDGKPAGTHQGGYDPFCFDISALIKSGNLHELLVSVWDPGDDGYQPRGKQVNNPGGIFYTPTTGIWQTVWLEPVPESFIEDFTISTDIDNSKVRINSRIRNPNINDLIGLEISDKGKVLLNERYKPNQKIEVDLFNPQLWSPANPFLFDLTIRLIRNEKVLDEVTSYFGMRKISILKDDDGFNRLALNNEIIFQNGPLDQGFWPDGLYTPPTDEAMRYDIEIIREMGFNMIRKHVKVENRRFYYWCDKLGILLWQDMPSTEGYVPPGGGDLKPSAEHKTQFETELIRMVETHFNHPSIVMWVPFNEGWGQYETQRIVGLVYLSDSTRLVNNTSGWQDRGCGDVIDIHHYPEPQCPDQEADRASVLGEFGGLGLYVEGHTWQKENWGYEKMQSIEELLIKYEDFYHDVFRLREENGLSGAVYTQTTDVETETNGLMTYDRIMVKMGIENIRNAHLGIIPPRLKTPFREFIESYTAELIPPDENSVIYYSLDGKEPSAQANLFKEPITIEKAKVLKARCIWPDGSQSRVISYEIRKAEPQKASILETSSGLKVSCYEGNWEVLPDFEKLTASKSGLTSKIDLSFISDKELFGLTFEGFLDVPETEVYILYLSADDGCRIYLDGNQFIDYDGIHGAGERKASVALEKGLHPFRLIYFQRYGGLDLKISWESPQLVKSEITWKFWKHN